MINEIEISGRHIHAMDVIEALDNDETDWSSARYSLMECMVDINSLTLEVQRLQEGELEHGQFAVLIHDLKSEVTAAELLLGLASVFDIGKTAEDHEISIRRINGGWSVCIWDEDHDEYFQSWSDETKAWEPYLDGTIYADRDDAIAVARQFCKA